ncbi:MAG: protein translocase subunit SecD [Bifidobacteriaceae bacterium]|jgi:preprotein translocase subunit SecD|nr:protein translocase subunit SecD [Bifidobacteriaceae bacterium]
MAVKKTKKAHPLRRVLALVLVVVAIFGSVGLGVFVFTSEENPSTASFAPGLALDLAGGTQIILTPLPEEGQTVNDVVINQAIEVIRQRIDASGVVEADIQKQGDNKIVVGIPGDAPDSATVDLISEAAQLRFRPVIYQNYDDMVTASNEEQEKAAKEQEEEAKKAEEEAKKTEEEKKADVEAEEKKAEENKDADKDADANADVEEEVEPSPVYVGKTGLDEIIKNGGKVDDKDDTAKGTISGYDQITEEDVKKYDEFDCSNEDNRKGGSADSADKVLISCGKEEPYIKYMLGPVAVEGDGISTATSALQRNQSGNSTGNWVVNLMLKDEAMDGFIETTNTIKTLTEPRNTFAIVLDGLVISAPSVKEDVSFTRGAGIEITFGSEDRQTQKQEAALLANQLSFGAMPMSFKIESNEQISATLGSEQLQLGLIAGLIGLLLVALYALWQYHVLGFVIIGSLLASASLTYGSILVLSWLMGYRLSLAGVIGVIVAIGVTADSFIVYFERIRDELRDGRSLNMAVTRGWNRAFKTILVADAVNIIAAVVLYMLAVGDVRGFAFTLGLTTFLDVIIVYLFTYPIVLMLSRRRFFYEGHPASGLSPERLGAINATRYEKRKKSKKDATATQTANDDAGETEADVNDDELENDNEVVETEVDENETKAGDDDGR